MNSKKDIKRIAAWLLVILLALGAVLVLLTLTGIIAQPETVIERFCQVLFSRP